MILLKLLNDPIKNHIIYYLSQDYKVKEIARELTRSQSNIYYHIEQIKKQLRWLQCK